MKPNTNNPVTKQTIKELSERHPQGFEIRHILPNRAARRAAQKKKK